jgi:hypothetical protein
MSTQHKYFSSTVTHIFKIPREICLFRNFDPYEIHRNFTDTLYTLQYKDTTDLRNYTNWILTVKKVTLPHCYE